MSLRDSLSSDWEKFQGELFPNLEETVGCLTESHKALIPVGDMTQLEVFVSHGHGLPGRPSAERAALARAFVAKAVLNLPNTRMLIERVEADKTLRRLCGWSRPSEVPSESTFSRAFAQGELPSRVHEALIRQTHADRLVGYPPPASFRHRHALNRRRSSRVIKKCGALNMILQQTGMDPCEETNFQLDGLKGRLASRSGVTLTVDGSL